MGKIWRSPADTEDEKSAEAGFAGGSNTPKVVLQTLGMLFAATALLVLVGTWLSDFHDQPVAPRIGASTTSIPTTPPQARTPTSSTTEPSSTIDQPSAKKTSPPTPPAALPATASGAATPSEAATAAGVSSGPATPTPQQAPASLLPPDTAPTSWTVRPGDDLWSIAGEVLGRTAGGTADSAMTTAYWRTLVAVNGSVLADPNLLHPGEVLTLPAATANPGQTTSPAPPPPSGAPAGSTPAATWTVRSGDDLWSIAQAVVDGTSGQTPSTADTTAYWRTLVAANRSIVSEPNLVYAGQMLTLPPLWD